MGLIEELGDLALATRLRRLADRLQQEVSRVYDAQHVEVRARWFPLLIALDRRSPRAVTDLARELGLTHTAVHQIGAEMARRGLLASARDTADRRQRLLSLTRQGRRAVDRLRPLWIDIRVATRELVSESGHDLLGAVAAVEERLDQRSMMQRMAEAAAKGTVEIVDLAPGLEGGFRDLNLEWLRAHFSVEDSDRKLLDDPRGEIVDRGGAVLLARAGEEVVGTVALIRRSARVFELAKMAVRVERRGRGIGRRLAQAALTRARALGARQIVLLTSPTLVAANALYRSLGFLPARRLPRGVPRYSRESFALQLPLDRPAGQRRRP